MVIYRYLKVSGAEKINALFRVKKQSIQHSELIPAFYLLQFPEKFLVVLLFSA